MENTQSVSKFKLTVLWTIICLSIFLFIVPNSAQAKKVFIPEAKPWETPEGRACFEQWIREAMAKMNAYNGSDDYNARKPWRINRYGILEGNPKYGPTSVYAPDNWSQYNGNRYWYMWDYWHAPSGVWGKPDLNAAGVPHIRPYIQNCLRKAGVGSGGTQQQVTNARCDQYARTAVAQNQENIRRRCNYKGARWGNNYKVHYDWCKRESKAFADSETKAREDGLIKCRGGAGPATGAGGAITGHRAPFQTKSRDVVGRNEILRGDGVNDWMFAISLRAEGTIKSITIRNTDGEFSVWDTKPNNGYWLLGVTTYDKRVINKSDGSVYFNVSGRTDLYLLAADNGSSLRQGKTNYKVIIEFVDGRVLERNVGSSSGQPPETGQDIRWLTDRVWQFGRGDGSVIAGGIRLRSGGKIEGYSHYNESRWGLEGNTLVFYDGSGKPTCRFTTVRTVDGRIVLSGPFLSNTRITHVLREVGAQQPQSAQPPGIPGAPATGAGGTQQQVTNSRCDQYARTAVAQNQENIRRRCNYKGARWDNNYQGHYDWCVRVSKAFADSETKAREDELTRCRGGAGPTTGAEVDWNNRPWLDPRVIRCVREYLDKWLVYVNQQRQRRNEPPFTRIDDWGRALRPPVITATGGVDGNWDNSAHFVWGAYNTPAHINSPLGGVQNYVKECVRRGGGGLGPPLGQPQTGTSALCAPKAGDTLVWSGPVSSSGQRTGSIALGNGQSYYIVVKGYVNFGIWSQNSKTLLNDACYEFNSKGYPNALPVFKNNLNIPVCDNRYHPDHVYCSAPFVSSGQPLNFWIFDTYYGDNSGSLSVEVYQVGGAGPTTGAGGAITGHRAPFQTKSRDVVGRNEILRGDGTNDWMFAISLRAEGTIKSITIRNTDGEFSVWDTKPNNGYWLLGVTTYDKRVLNKSDGSVFFNVSGRTDLYLLAADNGSSLRQGKTNYKVIIEFVDGRVLERNVGSASAQAPGTDQDIRWLTDRVWQFGRGDGSVIANSIRLRPGGKIEGYSHYNESRWGLEGNTLVFYDGGGKPTCRFNTVRTVSGGMVLSGPFLPNQKIIHVLREVAAQQTQPAQPPRPLSGVKPVPTERDDEGNPFDENYQQFIQTQTIRDENRTAGLQDQMAADVASSYTRNEERFGDRLSDMLDEVHPVGQSPEEPTPSSDQGTEGEEQASSGTSPSTGPSGGQGGTSTPERRCETVGLNSGSWRQLQNNRGPLSQGQGGLVLNGDEWTNGKLKNGKFDGNGVESNKVFDLKNGGDVYMTFKVNDGGKYLAIFPKVFSEAGYKLLTTDHVWAGSVVVPNNTNLYAHTNVDTNGKYKTTVCKGNYDDNGGSIISEYSGTLKNRTGRVRIRFVDNYAGVKSYLVILHAEVCAQDAAVTAVPTKPPTQIGCDKTTKQGGNKPETFIVELGQKSGTFIFKYNMFSVPDRMLVEYEGRKLFDTGCTGNKHGSGKGVGSKSITYSGASTKVTVKVLPSCEGGNTQWTFTASCPD